MDNPKFLPATPLNDLFGANPLEATQGLMVACTDLEGRFVYANRAYLQYAGLRSVPVGAFALEGVAAADALQVLETARKALAHPGQAFWVEFSKQLKRSWNRSRWEFMAICDSKGRPAGLQCFGYDITDACRQNRFREASIDLLSLGLGETLCPEDLLRRALDAALAVVPAAQAGSATLLYPDGRLHFVAAQGYDLAALKQACLDPLEPLSLSQHIQARVFTQADLARFNARLDPKRRAVLVGQGRSGAIQAMLATPVVVGGEPRAYLYLDHFEQADAFDDLDMRHAEGLAHHVALLLYGGELQEQVRFGRYHDAQTGLPNLRGLQELLEGLSPAPRALMALRCRSLERIRRLEGDAVWVALVREIARILQGELRMADWLAWDEGAFWLLLEGIGEPEEALSVLRRLREGVMVRLESRWPQLEFNPQVGVALARPGLEGPELSHAARSALQQSYHPDSVRFFDPVLLRKTTEEDILRQALGQALRPLRSGDKAHPFGFTLHYQPIWQLKDRRLHHFEALLRWTHPELGPIPPVKFLPLVEEEGWMMELGDWILRTVVQQAAQWRVAVAVNLAGSQLGPDLLQRLGAHLELYGLPPQQLICEVTEQVALDGASLGILQALSVQGHPLHLDDFGSGMSSLERLTRLPLSALKLGQGFMLNLGPIPCTDTSEARLLHALRGLADGLGLDIIVEGIETDAQLTFLLKEGFLLGQGYLLGRPAPYSDAEVSGLLRRKLRRR